MKKTSELVVVGVVSRRVPKLARLVLSAVIVGGALLCSGCSSQTTPGAVSVTAMPGGGSTPQPMPTLPVEAVAVLPTAQGLSSGGTFPEWFSPNEESVRWQVDLMMALDGGGGVFSRENVRAKFYFEDPDTANSGVIIALESITSYGEYPTGTVFVLRQRLNEQGQLQDYLLPLVPPEGSAINYDFANDRWIVVNEEGTTTHLLADNHWLVRDPYSLEESADYPEAVKQQLYWLATLGISFGEEGVYPAVLCLDGGDNSACGQNSGPTTEGIPDQWLVAAVDTRREGSAVGPGIWVTEGGRTETRSGEIVIRGGQLRLAAPLPSEEQLEGGRIDWYQRSDGNYTLAVYKNERAVWLWDQESQTWKENFIEGIRVEEDSQGRQVLIAEENNPWGLEPGTEMGLKLGDVVGLYPEIIGRLWRAGERILPFPLIIEEDDLAGVNLRFVREARISPNGTPEMGLDGLPVGTRVSPLPYERFWDFFGVDDSGEGIFGAIKEIFSLDQGYEVRRNSAIYLVLTTEGRILWIQISCLLNYDSMSGDWQVANTPDNFTQIFLVVGEFLRRDGSLATAEDFEKITIGYSGNDLIVRGATTEEKRVLVEEFLRNNGLGNLPVLIIE